MSQEGKKSQGEEKDHLKLRASSDCNQVEERSTTTRSSTKVTILPSSESLSDRQKHTTTETPASMPMTSRSSATQRKRRSSEMSGNHSSPSIECASLPRPSQPSPPFPISHTPEKKMRSTLNHPIPPSRPKHPHDQSSLAFLCLSKSWMAATRRAQTHPQEAQYGCTSSARTLLPRNQESNPMRNNSIASSPLALACRYNAPSECIRAILNANPSMVRRCIPKRGTPIHEAIMLLRNDDSFMEYVAIIRMLLVADEQLPVHEGGGGKRATLMQDVDGSVPLHLLVRQAFYEYLVGTSDYGRENEILERDRQEDAQEHPLLGIIRDLIESSPEAVAIQDCTQYEETPLILALKSSAHANEQMLRNSDASDAIQSKCNAE